MKHSAEDSGSRPGIAAGSPLYEEAMTGMIDLSGFDDVEVMPVREDPDQGICEPVPDAPHTATFWTVYGHLRQGGAEDLIDCYDEASAEIAAAILEQALTAPALRAAADELHAALRAPDTAVEPAR